MTKQEFEEKTFGYHVSQPIPTTRVLKKRHRYRESRDTSLNDVHHARLEEGNPPSDWWGLYGSDKHRKEVIRKDIERHMNHEIKILERDLDERRGCECHLRVFRPWHCSYLLCTK